MDHFGSFLGKFKKFTIPNKDIRECVALRCGLIIKKEIPVSSVRVLGRILYIDLHPTIKGEILLHKKEILDEINTTLKPKQQLFLDIR